MPARSLISHQVPDLRLEGYTLLPERSGEVFAVAVPKGGEPPRRSLRRCECDSRSTARGPAGLLVDVRTGLIVAEEILGEILHHPLIDVGLVIGIGMPLARQI